MVRRSGSAHVSLGVLGALLFAFAAVCISKPSWAAEVLSYDILRDGSAIGEQVVVVDGETVRVTQLIEVKALFVTLYRRSHSRSETWADGRIVSLVAETDDDGTPYQLKIEAEGEGYRRSVNGATRRFGPEYGPVPDWSLKAGGRPRGFSAQTDEVFEQVTLESLGDAVIDLPSGSYEVEQWRSSGDYRRDLWYDADGHLVRMLFERNGSEIEYRRR